MKFAFALLVASVMMQGIAASPPVGNPGPTPTPAPTTTTPAPTTTTPAPTTTHIRPTQTPQPPVCTEGCCDVGCARNFLHRNLTKSSVKYYSVDGNRPGKVTYDVDNPFLHKSCRCHVTDMCHTLCERNCSVETVPNVGKQSKSLYLSDSSMIEQYRMNAALGLAVCTFCVSPLPRPQDNCPDQRQAIFSQASCLTLSNCPIMPQGSLFVKFLDNHGSQPEIGYSPVLVGKNDHEDAILIKLDKNYDYLVTSCCDLEVVGQAVCTDDEKVVSIQDESGEVGRRENTY